MGKSRQFAIEPNADRSSKLESPQYQTFVETALNLELEKTPSKKTPISDTERAKRIREAARDAETSNDPADFERAFAAVTSAPKKTKSP